MEKEIKIVPPEEIQGNELRIICPPGMEIDKENSTFDCIKFKPVAEKWRDNGNATVSGFYIDNHSHIYCNRGKNATYNYNLFATNKQARSALAMAQISQIMANDERFGGVVTDEEWKDTTLKFVINRVRNTINKSAFANSHEFLSFHTQEQRDLFLMENEDLVKGYLMID